MFADRLTLSYPRGSTTPQLGWRRQGEGGRILVRHTMRISGELRIVTLFETEVAMALQVYTPAWQDNAVFRLGAADRLMLLGYEKLGVAATVLAHALTRVVCHPRLDGLFVTTAATVRYQRGLLDAAKAAFADRPGAGGFVGSRAGVAGPMVGLNVSSAHKARKMQRIRNAAALLDESTEDREAVVGKAPVRPTVDVRLDRSILRVARRIGSHYTITTLSLVSMFDAPDGQPWGLGVAVYLPKQSLRYLLALRVDQVAAIINDARLEAWEKDMLVHEAVYKQWESRVAALRLQESAAVAKYDAYVVAKAEAKKKAKEAEELRRKATIEVSDTEEDEVGGGHARSLPPPPMHTPVHPNTPQHTATHLSTPPFAPFACSRLFSRRLEGKVRAQRPCAPRRLAPVPCFPFLSLVAACTVGAQASDAESVNSEEAAAAAAAAAEAAAAEEAEEEGPDSEDERELAACDSVKAALRSEMKQRPPAPPRPSGTVWPADSRETGITYCNVRVFLTRTLLEASSCVPVCCRHHGARGRGWGADLDQGRSESVLRR